MFPFVQFQSPLLVSNGTGGVQKRHGTKKPASDICSFTATDGRFVLDEKVCEVELIAIILWDSVSVDESSLKYERGIDMVLVMKVNNTFGYRRSKKKSRNASIQ